ncbi:MAG: bifunctional acyl-ACP--phospholipid O-acyltransferase/long-chain-fatty-acid--ACP ligase [Halothiobacillus sp.]|jgi:acyl-[acyl-carrier-protein]-phospholipid O-acyltransferase/long-chain-fatty-acid--[acyl-carrier-protein] ligase|nr:bifunctional acyl-ACP--phospholipid O-acyltransferase/long-chain-fatty-acid--ACP ligase [Halothiobacillus sp.]
MKTLIRKMIRSVLRGVLRFLFRIDVRDRGNVRWGGRQLIVANHESYLDGLMIGVFLPVDPVFVVHTGIMRNRWFRWGLKLVDTIAVDPMHPIGMKTVLKTLSQGRPVVIFPEGRISDTGGLMKVYDGPAMLAARSQSEIIPVRLDGLKRSYFSRMSAVQPKALFPRVTLTILPVTRIEFSQAPTARERRSDAGQAMRSIMQQMLFASRPQQTIWQAYLATTRTFGRGRDVLEDVKAPEYRYGQIQSMALVLGRVVARVSREGEAIGLLLPNLAVTVALFLGLNAVRRTPAMLNYSAGPVGIASACHTAQVRTVISSRVFLEQARLTGLFTEMPEVRVIYIEDLRAQISWRDRLWLLGFARWFPARAVPDVASAEDPAAILFTSGSEGRPKGVVLSHRALMANVAQVQSVFDLTPADKVLNVLPIFHAFGLTGGLLLPLLTGARVFLHVSPLHYKLVPEIAYDRNCTLLFGTSTFLANYGKFAHPYDFHKLRYVISGAEKLNDAVRTLWYEKFGLRIFEGYGVTETGPVLAVNTPMAYRTGTVGQLLPGIEARLQPVPGIDQGGVLCVRAPNLMTGYLRYETPGVIEPPQVEGLGAGWYSTGDIVSIDAQRFVTILGRLKRFAKVAGEMVSLETVEAIARSAAPYAEHAATNVPDAQRGEQIVLITTDPALTRAQLTETCSRLGQPELAIPRRIIVVETIPLLGTGKSDYVQIKQLAETAA